MSISLTSLAILWWLWPCLLWLSHSIPNAYHWAWHTEGVQEIFVVDWICSSTSVWILQSIGGKECGHWCSGHFLGERAPESQVGMLTISSTLLPQVTWVWFLLLLLEASLLVQPYSRAFIYKASGKEGFDQCANKAKMTPYGSANNFFSRETWVNSIYIFLWEHLDTPWVLLPTSEGSW